MNEDDLEIDGEKLSNWLNTHTHSTGYGPSGPPLGTITPAALGGSPKSFTISASSWVDDTTGNSVNIGYPYTTTTGAGTTITPWNNQPALDVTGDLRVNGKDYEEQVELTEDAIKFLMELQLRPKKQHPDVMRKYVGHDGLLIKYVPSDLQTPELQMIAVTDNPWSIQHIKNPTRKAQGQAIVGDPDVKEVIENLDPTLDIFDI